MSSSEIDYLARVGHFEASLTKSLHYLGGPHSTLDSLLALHPAAPGSILGLPKKITLLE